MPSCELTVRILNTRFGCLAKHTYVFYRFTNELEVELWRAPTHGYCLSVKHLPPTVYEEIITTLTQEGLCSRSINWQPDPPPPVSADPHNYGFMATRYRGNDAVFAYQGFRRSLEVTA